MAETRAGITVELEPQKVLPRRYRLDDFAPYPKPGLSRQVFISLLMCFPLACMVWAAIIYGAVRLAR